MTEPGSESDDLPETSFTELWSEPDRDGVSVLRDTEAESGDETEMRDLYDLDETEAEELGIKLDALEPDEPPLD